MVRDNHQPPARAQHPQRLFERHLQRLHLAVDLDAQRLKQLRKELRPVLAGGAGRNGLHQLPRREYRLRTAAAVDARGDLPRSLQLAPVAQHPRQSIRIVPVHHIGRGTAAATVHTHVQRAVAAERESSRRIVEVVRRYSQIGQYAVHLPHAAQTQRPTHETEVALHVVQTPVVGDVGLGVAVLIEGIEPPLRPQGREYAARMPAAAEGKVDVGARRVDLKQRYGLVGHDGYVVWYGARRGCHFQKRIFGGKVTAFGIILDGLAAYIFSAAAPPRPYLNNIHPPRPPAPDKKIRPSARKSRANFGGLYFYG